MQWCSQWNGVEQFYIMLLLQKSFKKMLIEALRNKHKGQTTEKLYGSIQG
jgi:hypothetical protein